MCKRTADCMCERTARDYSATACRRATPHTFFIWLSVHIQRPMVRRLWLADLRWLQLRLDLVIFLKVGCAAQQARSADTGGSHLHTAAEPASGAPSSHFIERERARSSISSAWPLAASSSLFLSDTVRFILEGSRSTCAGAPALLAPGCLYLAGAGVTAECGACSYALSTVLSRQPITEYRAYQYALGLQQLVMSGQPRP